MNEQKKQAIISALKEVYDPEIPINVYDLGLIYDIYEKEDKLHILMTFTSPTCPTGEFIISCIKDALAKVLGSQELEVEVTFDPLWNPNRINPEIREELGFMIPSVENSVSNLPEESSECLNLCFNCACSDIERPLFTAKYKSENVFICAKCLARFQ
jgi:metal-sulfur cluster biosynthetic enzyme